MREGIKYIGPKKLAQLAEKRRRDREPEVKKVTLTIQQQADQLRNKWKRESYTKA